MPEEEEEEEEEEEVEEEEGEGGGQRVRDGTLLILRTSVVRPLSSTPSEMPGRPLSAPTLR